MNSNEHLVIYKNGKEYLTFEDHDALAYWYRTHDVVVVDGENWRDAFAGNEMNDDEIEKLQSQLEEENKSKEQEFLAALSNQENSYRFYLEPADSTYADELIFKVEEKDIIEMIITVLREKGVRFNIASTHTIYVDIKESFEDDEYSTKEKIRISDHPSNLINKRNNPNLEIDLSKIEDVDEFAENIQIALKNNVVESIEQYIYKEENKMNINKAFEKVKAKYKKEDLRRIELKPIKTVAGIEKFFNYVMDDLELGAAFHPDTPFSDYTVMATDKPTFTRTHAERLQKRMDEAFKIAEKKLPNKKYEDIYVIGLEKAQSYLHNPGKAFYAEKKEPEIIPDETSNLKPETLNLKPETSNPKPETSNLKPETPNPLHIYPPDRIAELKKLIAGHLETCNPANTPTVCAMKNEKGGVERLENEIIQRIIKNGFTVGDAIIQIEREFNPNLD